MSQLVKTEALVLSSIKYKDSSLICRMFTRDHGHQSFIINNVRSSKAKVKSALFQPMTLLELVYYDNTKASLHRISEVKIKYPYQNIPFDIIKSSILLFLSEVLSKCLQEERENEELYDFLNNALIFFDQEKGHLADFHLRLMLKMSDHLGLGTTNIGEMVEQLEYEVGQSISAQNEYYLSKLISTDFGEDIGLNKHIRSELLHLIISFYRSHLHSFGQIKSLAILQEVLS